MKWKTFVMICDAGEGTPTCARWEMLLRKAIHKEIICFNRLNRPPGWLSLIQTINLGHIPISKKDAFIATNAIFLGLLLIQPSIHLPADQGYDVICKHF